MIIPIDYCEADQAIVTAFSNLADDCKDPGYWSDKGLEKLKSRIKDHYITVQKTRCCYCNNLILSRNHRVWDVEHIAARAKHVRFMFEPRNLAASCPDCNLSKGDKEVLVNPSRKTYPTASKDFKIIHPHFDRYEDHISCREFIYIPFTNKGKFTIYACDLLRFTVDFMGMKGSAADKSFEEEVDAAFNAKNEPGLADIALELIMLQIPTNQ
ncbi:HNH endonuclease [Pseudomonas sp. KnCO4]|uniref:HNH endonuclease n=1 Tax=Pseudomonas sp. KnCO4 TaxID=3381355 RepID=UPI003877A6A9